MMQSVSVYLRDGKYFIVTIHGSGGSDPSIASGPVKELAATVSAGELGATVQQGLAASTHNLPWPKDFKKVTEPLLAAAQVKSWSTFAKRAVNLRVNLAGNTIAILPSRRSATGSFDYIPERDLSLTAPDAPTLGAAISAELARDHSK
jgi:hypothetical protein